MVEYLIDLIDSDARGRCLNDVITRPCFISNLVLHSWCSKFFQRMIRNHLLQSKYKLASKVIEKYAYTHKETEKMV